jgi:hypothetical protein
VRAVSFSDDPGRAAAYFSEGRGPTRYADRARDEMIAELELEDEYAEGGPYAGLDDEA